MGDSLIIPLFILTLLPLSTISQGGDREFSWVGPPLMLVLTYIYAKVRTSNMGQPLLMTKLLLPTGSPNLNPTKLLVPFITPKTKCPCRSIDFCPYN